VTGKITLDFDAEPGKAEPFLKGVLLEALADAGMRIEDLDAWTPEVKGTTFSLSGELASSSLRKMLSIIQSPAAAAASEKAAASTAPATSPTTSSTSPGDAAANQGKSTLRYFQSVMKFLEDIKGDMRDLKTMGQAAVWCDKYARKIEKLPMLGVDPDMLDYGKFVATSLRGGALNTRQTNIQAGAMQYQVGAGSQSGVGTGYYDPNYYGGYGYGRGVYGGGWYRGGRVAGAAATHEAARQELRAESQQRRILRTQARAGIAGDLQSMKAQIVQVTNDVRRTMTERYKLEF
jgi:hypothetical protein